MSNNKTSHHICGFWFHIEWDNHKEGKDQHGNEWMMAGDRPVPKDRTIIDQYLDAFNKINNGLGI